MKIGLPVRKVASDAGTTFLAARLPAKPRSGIMMANAEQEADRGRRYRCDDGLASCPPTLASVPEVPFRAGRPGCGLGFMSAR